MTNKEKIDYVFAHYNKRRNRTIVKFIGSLFAIISVIIALLYPLIGSKVTENDGGIIFILVLLFIIVIAMIIIRASHYYSFTKVAYNEKFDIFGIYDDGNNHCFGIDLFYRIRHIGKSTKYANDLDKSEIQSELLSIYEKLRKEELDNKNKSEKYKNTDLTDLYNKAD